MSGQEDVPEATFARIRALPLWKGTIAVQPLMGGISNESWLVRDEAGGHVVRFGADYPFHHVWREREIMSARAAEAAGFGPSVEYHGDEVLVSRFLDARTFDKPTVRADLGRIATVIRRFHNEMPRLVSGSVGLFWPFHMVRDYARTLEAANSRMKPRLGEFVALANRLEVVQMPLPIIFGHNDLLPANLLDDGERIWIIDFEYAGFSTAMSDLAGLSSNASFSREESEELLGVYFDRSPDRDLRRSLAAMQCVSLLREAMWSMVSEHHFDTPRTDYVAYSDENLERLAAALDAYHTEYGRGE